MYFWNNTNRQWATDEFYFDRDLRWVAMEYKVFTYMYYENCKYQEEFAFNSTSIDDCQLV